MDHLFVCDPKERGSDAWKTRAKYDRKDSRKRYNRGTSTGLRLGNVQTHVGAWDWPGKISRRVSNRVLAKQEMKEHAD